MKISSVKLRIYGRVQGVGFRPFVYRLATALELKGYVLNSSKGVEILLQGSESSIKKFIGDLKEKAPPLSYISKIEEDVIESEPFAEFKIEKSKKEEGLVFISPDIAVCDDCLREMRDPKDRRYRYPFINCTNCGPRYTIIEDIPYDRVKTTMKKFKMCDLCEAEYKDPLSRRFHAQPNSCYDCGPELWIEGVKTADVFKEIAELLKAGKILAIKGLGGFHLACNATLDDVVNRLRARKKRPHKPFALMMKDLNMVEHYCYVSDKEKELLKSLQSPIVLLKIKNRDDVADSVAPNNNYLGVMLPYTPYHYLIFEHIDFPLVMTSANFSDSPIIKDNEEAKLKLKTIVDFFVFHNRDIRHRVDDSVLFIENENIQIIRRARGYAPDPVKLPIRVRPSLALGPELKNTFTLAKDDTAILSPHIGDLKNNDIMQVFEETIDEYLRLFKIEPEFLIADMHPSYMTTELAERSKDYIEIKYVQHHKAHIYSLLFDNQFTGKVIGIAFDGTGFGEDGNIWGGEVFIGDLRGLERVYHFDYFPIVGGDSAIKNPKRIALSFIISQLPEVESFIAHKFTPFEIELVKRMVDHGKVFYTSSVGRIFDIVASILDIRDKITYEAQAAIEVQMQGELVEHNDFYSFEIKNRRVVFASMILGIIEDKLAKKGVPYIARKFHNTIAEIIKVLSERVREEKDINLVGLSGGVFQNRLLLKLTLRKLKEAGFKVLLHKNVPSNDGGVSLGQLAASLVE